MKRYILIWRTSLFLVVSNEMREGGFVSPLYTIKQLFCFIANRTRCLLVRND